jgi:hypothetical protein
MNNNLITSIGLLASALVTFLFFFWGYPFALPAPLFKSLLLGMFFQLGVWQLNKTYADLSLSLLGVFTVLIALGFLPGGILILLAGAAVLFGLFLRDLRKEKGDRLLFSLFGLAFGLFIFLSTCDGVGDVFIAERIRQFGLNPDTLFHIAVADFFRNYRVFTTGLYGLVPLKYHILSHIFYGSAADLFQMQQYEIYGYTNFIGFAPLLISSWLHVLSSISEKKNISLPFICLVFMGGPLGLYFGHHWDSHFISESYMLSLIFLAGFMTIMNRMIHDEKLTLPFYALAFFYILLMLLAKVSVGVVAGCVFVYLVFENKKFSPFKTLLPALVTGLVLLWGFWATKYPDIEGHKASFAWRWFENEFFPHHEFLFFLCIHFPYIFALIPLLLYKMTRQEVDPRLRRWIISSVICVLLGFLGLNLMLSSSGYYFSNIHAFFILPLMVLLWDRAPPHTLQEFFASLKRKSFLKSFGFLLSACAAVLLILAKTGTFVALGLLGIALLLCLPYLRKLSQNPALPLLLHGSLVFFMGCNIIYFAAFLLPKQIRELKNIKHLIVQNVDFKNPYLDLLARVKSDPDKGIMVYIPKSEDQFWNNGGGYARWKNEQCMDMPLYIPLLTEKPALFALPSPQCHIFHRGYELYSAEDYEKSQKRDYSPEELCAETLELGFRGYYRVTAAEGAVKHSCNSGS